FKVAELFGLATVHAEQIGGAGHVDIKKGAAHEEVRGLGSDVLGQFDEALGGDNTREATLAATAHEVGHGAKRELARFVGHIASGGGREKLGFINHHKDGIPIVAVGVEKAAKEGGGGPHLLLDIEPFEIEHDGNAMLADAGRDAGQLVFSAGGIDDKVAIGLGQRDE